MTAILIVNFMSITNINETLARILVWPRKISTLCRELGNLRFRIYHFNLYCRLLNDSLNDYRIFVAKRKFTISEKTFIKVKFVDDDDNETIVDVIIIVLIQFFFCSFPLIFDICIFIILNSFFNFYSLTNKKCMH